MAAGSGLDDITGEIVDAAYRLHCSLGPGLLESVYETVWPAILSGAHYLAPPNRVMARRVRATQVTVSLSSQFILVMAALVAAIHFPEAERCLAPLLENGWPGRAGP
jgi:hypothetical protein